MYSEKQPETFHALINWCQNKYDVLKLYEIGYINEKLLRDVNAIPQNYISSYINFYNLKIKVNASDFHLPLF